MSNWLKTNLPCPCGTSSDSYALDRDGNGYCFSGYCKKPYFNKFQTKEAQVRDLNTKVYSTKDEGPKFKDGDLRIISHRSLSESTLRFYDIRTRFVNNEPFEVGFKYPTFIKIRNLLEKNKMRSEGEAKGAGLYGKDKFDPGSKESITITVGEWDAPSIYEATRGQTAAVSCRSDSQAKRDCTVDRDYINSFNKIILCFDNDESGQKAAKDVSSLFDFNKLYHVRLTKYKDASEYFQNGEADNLEKIWKAAKRYSPDNIISQFSDIRAALKKSQEDQIGTYPFKSLQSMTYGLHRGEIVVFKGMEKLGKTSIFRAIQHHLLKTTDKNIGIIHLEEDNGTTIKGIVEYELQQPVIRPDSGLSEDDIFNGYVKAVSGSDTRVHLYQSFETEDEELFLDSLRFLAAGAGCQFIFLDHISWLATGKSDSDDERKKLDRISQKLKLLAKELGICILMISHVNDEGKTRGSRNITKVANTIIHMDRDKLSIDETTRRTTHLTLEGVRLGGLTGPAGALYMDAMTDCLRDLEYNDNFPESDKGFEFTARKAG